LHCSFKKKRTKDTEQRKLDVVERASCPSSTLSNKPESLGEVHRPEEANLRELDVEHLDVDNRHLDNRHLDVDSQHRHHAGPERDSFPYELVPQPLSLGHRHSKSGH
jgi:hypothetical protein